MARLGKAIVSPENSGFPTYCQDKALVFEKGCVCEKQICDKRIKDKYDNFFIIAFYKNGLLVNNWKKKKQQAKTKFFERSFLLIELGLQITIFFQKTDSFISTINSYPGDCIICLFSPPRRS